MASTLQPLLEIEYRAAWLEQELEGCELPGVMEELAGLRQAADRARSDEREVLGRIQRIERLVETLSPIGDTRPTLRLLPPEGDDDA